MSKCFSAFLLFFVSIFCSASAAEYQVIVEPEQGPQALVNMINQAKEQIQISIYQFMDSSGEESDVVKRLAAISKLGVKVEFLINDFLHEDFPPDGKEIYKYEIDWCNKNGIRCTPASSAFTFTHNKYIIIDGKQVSIMTLNLSQEDFDGHARNFVVTSKNRKDVSFVSSLYNIDLLNAENETKNSPRYIPDDMILSPVNAPERLEEAINSATKTLDIYEMYFSESCPEEIIDAIVHVAKRGVKVRIITNSQFKDSAIVIGNMQKQSSNIQAILITPEENFFIHAKVFIIDGSKVVSGSINLSSDSIEDNRELDVIIHEPTAVSPFVKTFEYDWARFKPEKAKRQGV